MITAVRRIGSDHLEITNTITAARTDGTNGTSRTNGTYWTYGGGTGGGGGVGVPASSPENIIRIQKTDRARPGHLENIKRRGITAAAPPAWK
jgi:hypothetical protein